MEFFLQMVTTAVFAVSFSFIVTKLLSIAMPLCSVTTPKPNQLLLRKNIRPQELQSVKRVRFVEQQTIQKLDRFHGESVPVDEIRAECEELDVELRKTSPEKEEMERTERNQDVAVEKYEEIRETETEELVIEDKDEELVIEEEDEELVIEDEDWEGIERSELETPFVVAAEIDEESNKIGTVSSNGDDDDDDEMKLYALHKIATAGPFFEQQPMAVGLKLSVSA